MESSVSSRVLRRAEKELAQTKVILRHLPPDYTKEKLTALIDPLPPFDCYMFVIGSPELGKFGCSRAYINFKHSQDIVPFRDTFDGTVLESESNIKYRMIIELAPYQIIPRGRGKTDHRCGTITDDPEYKEFLQKYEKETNPLPSVDVTYLHEVEKMKVDSLQATPLTDYLRNKYLVPKSHKGSGQRNKVLYAGGGKRKKDRGGKDSSKGKGKGGSSSRKEKRSSNKGDIGAESASSNSPKIIVVERPGRGQNGVDSKGGGREEKSFKLSSSGKITTESSSRTRGGGAGGGAKQPDQPLYVPGGGGGKSNSRRGGGGGGPGGEETKKRDTGGRGGEGRRKGGGGRNRDTHGYSKHGRGQYNDRHDNHYDFKDDDDSYQGPDYNGKARNKEDYDGDGGSSTRYYGSKGRNHDRYDNGSKSGWDGRYRSHK